MHILLYKNVQSSLRSNPTHLFAIQKQNQEQALEERVQKQKNH